MVAPGRGARPGSGRDRAGPRRVDGLLLRGRAHPSLPPGAVRRAGCARPRDRHGGGVGGVGRVAGHGRRLLSLRIAGTVARAADRRAATAGRARARLGGRRHPRRGRGHVARPDGAAPTGTPAAGVPARRHRPGRLGGAPPAAGRLRRGGGVGADPPAPGVGIRPRAVGARRRDRGRGHRDRRGGRSPATVGYAGARGAPVARRGMDRGGPRHPGGGGGLDRAAPHVRHLPPGRPAGRLLGLERDVGRAGGRGGGGGRLGGRGGHGPRPSPAGGGGDRPGVRRGAPSRLAPPAVGGGRAVRTAPGGSRAHAGGVDPGHAGSGPRGLCAGRSSTC